MPEQEFLMPPHGGDRLIASQYYGVPVEDWLDFSANINPLGPPPVILEEVVRNWQLVARYPDPACRELKEAIARCYGVPVENIMVGNGAAEIIYLLVRALLPNKVTVYGPTFSEYERAARAVGAEVEWVQALEREEGFFFAELPLVTAPGRLIFICNPNNPTGTLTNRDYLLTLVEDASTRGAYVLVDQSFMDFLSDGERYSLMGEAGNRDNLIVLNSLTKFFALPGLRLGFAVLPPELINRLENLRDPWSVNVLAQLAGTVALADRDYMQETRLVIQEEKSFLWQQLNSLPGLQAFFPVVNFILVQLVPPLVHQFNSTALTAALGIKGVLVRDCANFTGLGGRYIRLAVRSRAENVKLISILGEICSGD